MVNKVSDTFRSLIDQINKEPMIVLEIEGSQYLYGSAPILETARWDDPRIKWDNNIGVTWDGEIEKANSKPYIMTKSGTTRRLTSQLLVDKGGSGSVQTFNVELVDYQGEVAKDLSFDQIGDPLSRKASIYVGIKGGRFPQDFIEVVKGYIDDLKYSAGSIGVSVALSTNLIRQSSYEQYQSILTSAIDNTQTTLSVATTNPLFLSQDAVLTHVRIDNEIMEVVSKNEGANTIEVIRERLGTIAVSHDFEAEVTSYYTLTGNPIDLILKLLHSREGNEFTQTSLEVTDLLRIDSTTLIDRAIVINDPDIETKLGLVPKDQIELIGTASNDGIKTIESFGRTLTRKSYIVVEEDLTEENSLNISLRVRSKYNVLPDGCNLDIDFVDTVAFEEVRSLFQSSFIDYTFKLDATIDDTREFIIKEICRPMSLYLISRKAKTSIKFTAPPFTIEQIPTLNTENLYDLTKIQMQRSTHKYLLNQVIFRYNTGTLDTGKFFDKLITINADSVNRIKAGRKVYTIESKGLARGSQTIQTLNRIGSRILNRYKYGSLYVKNVKVLFQVGLTIEIGDVVFFGGDDTKLVNLSTGDRNLPLEQYEVVNKELDIVRGEVVLQLLQTSFGIDGIFGTYSPASKVATGSTVNRLLVKSFWDSDQFNTERDKWNNLIGAKIRVVSDDYTYDETSTIDSIDLSTPNGLFLDPPLSVAPPVDANLELAKFEEYEGSEEDLDRTVKLTHTFTMPSALVTAVTDNKIFQVDPAEIGKFKVGMEVNIHSEDYTADSETRIIDDITSNTITLNEDADITIVEDYRIEVYAHPDDKGYRII